MQLGNHNQFGNIDYGYLIDSQFLVENYVVPPKDIRYVAGGVIFACDNLEVYGNYYIDGKVVVFRSPLIYGILVVNGVLEVK